MRFIADFHIHSKYARATSPRADLEHLDQAARTKGIKVLTTGDFTHPQWLKELKENLEPAEEGLYQLKSKIQNPKSKNGTRFILTTEISCIYSKNGRTRKIHVLIFAPDFETVEKINTQLGWIGNLKSDGRPILGLDAKELAKIVLGVSDQCLIVPAHIWTPWFSLFGSRSGFDSIEECFEEYSKYIFAVETGLSSDPPMNWRLSALDKITLISNSDAHSPAKIGREANVFDTELNYQSIVEAIKNPQGKLLSTIEFFPQEGRYHFDGHRNCGVTFSPEESRKHNNVCPKCGKPLTIGVLHRVEELADRPSGGKPATTIPFKSLIPLSEIIGEGLGYGPDSKAVKQEYDNLVKIFGSEFEVLLKAEPQELQNATLPPIAEGITRVRAGKVKISPGYDGVYGKIKIFGEEERSEAFGQKKLF